MTFRERPGGASYIAHTTRRGNSCNFYEIANVVALGVGNALVVMVDVLDWVKVVDDIEQHVGLGHGIVHSGCHCRRHRICMI